MLTLPVSYTLHLGEVNLILTALAGTDLLRRRDGGWWQGIATGISAGIKFTPLIFIAYLAITRRRRAAAVAAGSFAGTVAAGAIELPAQTRVYWLSGVFSDQNRVGNPANPSNQSLSGAVARLAGSLDAARGWWLAAEFVTALAGLAIAAWVHRRGHQFAGVASCAITGLLIADRLDPSLGMGDPAAGPAGRYRSAPPVRLVRPCRCRDRRRVLRLVPMPWPGHPLSPGRLIQGDPYVLCGLSVLAGAALTLTRETRRRQPC